MKSLRMRRHVTVATGPRKTEAAINRSEGNNELPHVYDDVIE